MCGDHWKATIEHRAVESEKDELLRMVKWASTKADYREILQRLVERSFN